MVEFQPSKLVAWVRFPSLAPKRVHKIDAPTKNPDFIGVFRIFKGKKARVGFMDENSKNRPCGGR